MMNQEIRTKAQLLATMSSTDLIVRVTEILNDLLQMSIYEARIIESQNFRDVQIDDDFKRKLFAELEQLNAVLVSRINLKEDVPKIYRKKLKSKHDELSKLTQENHTNISRVLVVNQLAIESISDAIAYQQKFEYGYDDHGKLPDDSVIEKNTKPLNLNQEC